MRKILASILVCFISTSILVAAPAATQNASLKESPDAALKQIKAIVPPRLDRSKQGDAAYMKKFAADRQAALEQRIALSKEFAKKFPTHEESPNMLLFGAQMTRDKDQQLEIYREIVKAYPDSDAAKTAKGPLQQIESIGKPFELSFTDATTDKKISMADLKGKVVVIDFWATWCGPCVGEMPEMKKLYEEYKPKGVEFIGVSLDQPKDKGGLDKLKKFVSENQITWPQYYQGNGWESEFSRGWGINSIPTMFIVDAAGNLSTTDARGQLETLLPELLAKAPKSAETPK